MRKLLLLPIILLTLSSYSQEKIIEFNTTHTNIGARHIKTNIKFELYDNKLIKTHLDNSTIKSLHKSGLESPYIFPYVFHKESNKYLNYYIYEDDTVQITIILRNLILPDTNPSIIFKAKVGLTGSIIEHSYYSL